MDYKRKYNIKNYDYIITSSSKNKPILASAFGVKEEQIKALGYADIDRLFDEDRIENSKNQILSKYPELKNKKIVLYAPTFRGEGVYEKKFLDTDIDNIANTLGNDYFVIYKMHPILNEKISLGSANNLKNLSNEDIYDLFSVADVLISDFSSIIYDFSILEKPVILHAPDLKEYEEERGLYVNYETFSPYKITRNEEELIETLKNINTTDKDDLISFKNNYFDFKDKNAAKRIAEFTSNLMNDN